MIFTLAPTTLAQKDIEQIKNKRISLEYQSANIQNVLNSLAKLANINIIINDDIQKTATADFEDIKLGKALDIITKVNGLKYIWQDNIIIVDTPSNINNFFGSERMTAELIEINYTNPNTLKTLLKETVSDIELQQLTEKTFLIKGLEGQIAKAKNYIQKFEKNFQEKGSITVGIKTEHIKNATVNKILSNLYPTIKTFVNDYNQKLMLNGQKEKVEKAIDKIKSMDKPLEDNSEGENNDNLGEEEGEGRNSKQIGIIEPKYINPQKALDLIKETQKDLDIKIDKDKLIVKGTGKVIEKIKKEVDELDKKYKDDALKFKPVSINYIKPSQAKTLISDMVSDLSIKVNEHNSELLFHGTQEDIDKAKQYIMQIDKPRKQVMIDIRMEEISRNKAKSLGVNPDELSEIKILTNGDKENPTLFDFDGISMSLPKFLSLMENQGIAENMANPRLMTLDGEKASMQIGDKIPFTTEKIEGEQKVSNTTYKDVGISFSFTPNISSDDTVTLKVNPQIDSLGSGGGSGDPVIKTRQVDTTIRLHHKQTFAIGGLIQEQTIKEFSGIPYLKDIPFFGKLFESQKTDNIKSEIIIFITPYIIGTDVIDNPNEKENNENIVEDPDQETIDKILENYEKHGFKKYFNKTKTEILETINK
jgi:type II secretory pathway component GspD/PulD (secretin)